MKNILIVLPVLPWPLTSGGNQGSFNSIAAIADEYNVIVTYDAGRKDKFASWHDEFRKALNDRVRIMPYIDNPSQWTARYRLKRYGRKLIEKITPATSDEQYESFVTTQTHCDGFYRFINDLIAAERIVIVQAEYIETLDIAPALPSNVRKIFVHHELRYVRNELAMPSYGFSFRKKALEEIERIKEIGLLNMYDGVMTVSSVDAEKLKKAGVTAPVYPSFSVVNTDAPFTANRPSDKILTFVGPEVHLPNREGLKWFMEEVWPVIKGRDPEYRLNIIGNWSDDSAKEWESRYDGISFLGFVPDLSSALRGSVMIVPITIGSGIRMKILEAMSYGVPFVSTAVGAEGIPVKDMESCRIADDPSAFAGCIFSLEDINLRNALAAEAYKIVKEDFSMESLKSNKLAIYKKLLEQ